MNVALLERPDYAAIKRKQNAAWSSGDYAVVGATLQIVGEQLAEATGLPSGVDVLDVAAGNGNATLAFARRWHRVTSTDYVEALLEKGRKRADAEGLDVAFQVADAEDLPFDNQSFDAVASTFGVMFAPDQDRAASELARVCRSGGKIAMANWTPDSFIGRLFQVIGRHVPPPSGVMSPANWGDEAWLRDRFGSVAANISVTRRHFVFRYLSAEHFIDVFRSLYGPVHKAFAALDEAGALKLEQDLRELIDGSNTAIDGVVAAPASYLEVVITKA